jgi:hypothetical protein
MKKEIKEILQLAAQLDKALNYKLADNLTASLIKLAQGLQLQQIRMPMQQIRIPTQLTIPKSSSPVINPVLPVSNFSTGLTSSPQDIKKHNEGVELTKLPENENVVDRANKKLKSRVEEQAKKAVKIWKLVKKPNNVYSDYVSNSKDIKLKDYNKKIQSLTENDVKSFIQNLIDPTFYTDEVKFKTEPILGWAFKMHIINYIPPAVGISFSRSAVKPGQNVDDKKTTKTEVKTKTEGRSLPTMPTLPSTPLIEKEEETVRPVQTPTERILPKSPIITTPLETQVFPAEDESTLLTPEIMTPILSPKRLTTTPEETNYGPMSWNEFLDFLNPNKTLSQAPTSTSLSVQDPSKVNVNEPVVPKPPTKDAPQNKEKPSNLQIPLKMDLPPMKEAPAGGISFMRSFR